MYRYIYIYINSYTCIHAYVYIYIYVYIFPTEHTHKVQSDRTDKQTNSTIPHESLLMTNSPTGHNHKTPQPAVPQQFTITPTANLPCTKAGCQNKSN